MHESECANGNAGDANPSREAWSACLERYASRAATAPEGDGVVRDHFGRAVDGRGLLLVDWEGPMGNPETQIQVTAPPDLRLPVTVSASIPNAPLVYLEAHSAVHDENGPRMTKPIQISGTDPQRTWKIGVNPDRDFEHESYSLQLQFESWDGTSKSVEVPIHVCDQDRRRPLEVNFTRKFLDPYGDQWFEGGGEWDRNQDGLHDGPQARELVDRIIDDVAYYLAPWNVDRVPTGAARAQVSWDPDDLQESQAANTEPFDQFYLFVTTGQSSTGIPGMHFHRQRGRPTELRSSGVLLMGRDHAWRVERDRTRGWFFHDGVSEDWWRSSRWQDGPSPTGDCPEGEQECRHYPNSFYSVMKHELLHTLGYSFKWPRWQHFVDVGCIDDPDVMAYTGRCTTVNGNHAWDPQLHLRKFNNGVELLDKFEMLVLQAVGWRLRETTPFVDLSITREGLPPATVGERYEADVPVRGGVPAYRFELVNGDLPPGVSLDSFTGTLSGTPTRAGTYRATVEVADSGTAGAVTSELEIVVR